MRSKSSSRIPVSKPASRGAVIAYAAMVLFATSAVADEIEVIFSEVPGHPTATVPGAVDLAGDPIMVEFKAMEDIAFAPDGSQWILKARNDGGSDIETMLLLGSGTSGSVFAQEGQPVHGGVAGELYDFFDPVAGFNDDGDYAYGARARNGDSTIKEKVIVFDGAYTVVAQESDPALGLTDDPPGASGDELFGNSLNSIHLLNDGSVGFVAVTIQNISSTRRPALFYDDTAFAQSGITGIGGGTWDSFDSNDFRTTPDGSTWVAQGDDEGDLGSDDILAVNGSVVLREGDEIVPGRTLDAVFATKLARNGDWFSRGDDTANDDWAVRNGTVLAVTGDPITVDSTENWGDTFLSVAGNAVGDWVIVGNTDLGDTARDNVVVLNGTDVVIREGDPVDLDGNGMFDDDAFIGRGTDTSSAFSPNDVFLTDDRVLYFIAPLRNAAGEDLGEFGAGGEAFMRLALPAPCSTGNVDAASGSAQDVLLVDATNGGATRSVTVSTGQGFTLGLDAAAGGPASDARYVVWAWIGGGQNATDLDAFGERVGCLVNPTPVNGGLVPQPRFCLPGTGIPPVACAGTSVKNVADRAPWSVNRAGGLGNPITLTLQGLIEDDTSAHPSGFSVTNAITLIVE